MDRIKLRILAIDDDPGDIEILRRYLEYVEMYEIEFEAFTEWHKALASLNANQPDLIFIDYRLSADTGLDVFRTIRENGCESPAVMLTGQGNEMVAVEAMKAGVADYVVKEDLNPDSILRVITNALSKFELENEIREQQRQLEELARTDGLTGLWNRRYLEERLIEYINEAVRYGSALSIMMLDLDHFKDVNDNLGHLTGDSVLSDLAMILQNTIRKTDHAARYGGEEFVVILTNSMLDGAKVVASRILNKVSEHVFKSNDGKEFHVTCSIGVAQLHSRSDNPDILFERADAALYEAKRNGRNRVVAEDALESLAV